MELGEISYCVILDHLKDLNATTSVPFNFMPVQIFPERNPQHIHSQRQVRRSYKLKIKQQDKICNK